MDNQTSDRTKCGICGSSRVDDLGKGRSEQATCICLDCQAKWCKVWRTKEDWEVWINEGYPPEEHVYFLETPAYCFHKVNKNKLEAFKKHFGKRGMKNLKVVPAESAISLAGMGHHRLYTAWA
jgi:hypothetical protein